MRIKLEEIVEEIGKGKRLTRGAVSVESYQFENGSGLVLYQGPDGRTAGLFVTPNQVADDKSQLMRLLEESNVKGYDPALFERYTAQGASFNLSEGASLQMNVSKDYAGGYQSDISLWDGIQSNRSMIYATFAALNLLTAMQTQSALSWVIGGVAAAYFGYKSFTSTSKKRTKGDGEYIGDFWENILDAQNAMRAAEQNEDVKEMRRIAQDAENSTQIFIQGMKEAIEEQRCGDPGVYVYKSGTRQEVLTWYEKFLAPLRTGKKGTMTVQDKGYAGDPRCGYCRVDIGDGDPVRFVDMEGVKRPVHEGECADEYKSGKVKGKRVRE